MVLPARASSPACLLHLGAGHGQLESTGASTMQPQSSLVQPHCPAWLSRAKGEPQPAKQQPDANSAGVLQPDPLPLQQACRLLLVHCHCSCSGSLLSMQVAAGRLNCHMHAQMLITPVVPSQRETLQAPSPCCCTCLNRGEPWTVPGRGLICDAGGPAGCRLHDEPEWHLPADSPELGLWDAAVCHHGIQQPPVADLDHKGANLQLSQDLQHHLQQGEQCYIQ